MGLGNYVILQTQPLSDLYLIRKLNNLCTIEAPPINPPDLDVHRPKRTSLPINHLLNDFHAMT